VFTFAGICNGFRSPNQRNERRAREDWRRALFWGDEKIKNSFSLGGCEYLGLSDELFDEHVRENGQDLTITQYARYQSAIRATKNAIVHGITSRALGLTDTTPTTEAEWITLYNPSSNLAPGGGNAFQAGYGSPTTGAIGVAMIGSGQHRIT